MMSYVSFAAIPLFRMICFPLGTAAPSGSRAFSLSMLHDNTHSYTPNSVGLRWTSVRPAALPDNAQHKQETDIHVPAVEPANPNKRATAYPRLKSRRPWDLSF